MLGSTVGSTSFAKEYPVHKFEDFVEQLENIYCQDSRTISPIGVYCILPLHYREMAIHNVDTLFQPLEDAIMQLNLYSCINYNWKMSVHIRRKETTHSTNTLYGGVSIVNPVTSASGQ